MARSDTTFKKGNKVGGRTKGTPNKVTRTVKETVLDVFLKLQAMPAHNLEAFAKNNPVQFYMIAAKLIPTEVTAAVELTGGVQIYLPENSRDAGEK